MYLTDSKLAKKFHLKNLNRKVLQLIGKVELTNKESVHIGTYVHGCYSETSYNNISCPIFKNSLFAWHRAFKRDYETATARTWLLILLKPLTL